jgi:hypothetical protein
MWQLAASKPPQTFDLALFEYLASNLNMLQSATTRPLLNKMIYFK